MTTVQVGGEQRQVGASFREQILALFDMQHPPIYQVQMGQLIGDCELESEERNGKGKAQPRAPKNSFSNERSTWLQKLNHIRVKIHGKERPLHPEERAALIDLPYEKNAVTTADLRSTLRERFGFSASWREASFNTVTYRVKAASDGAWLFCISSDGKEIPLSERGQGAEHKRRVLSLKERLTGGVMTFRQLRELFDISQSELLGFETKETEVIPASMESATPISFANASEANLIQTGHTYKILVPGRPRSLTPSKVAWRVLTALRETEQPATLADWRSAIERIESLPAGWQFELSTKRRTVVRLDEEQRIEVPLQFDDAQRVEGTKLIELRGWHSLRRALSESHPEWWSSLQVAWKRPSSEEGRSAAKLIDEIAQVLTVQQTDAEIEKELSVLGIDLPRIASLRTVTFSQFRNLSFVALRNILPGLELGLVYSDACKAAGYDHSQRPTQSRHLHLPPLATFVFNRYRHGNPHPTKAERRYRDLNNPVVARAFNQARLVLNELIDRYGCSPTYVHVELARDLARSKEERSKLANQQKENQVKRDSVKKAMAKTYGIDIPSDRQVLKERLYREQQGKCAYTPGDPGKLDLDRVLRDETYAQIDHIWPRSKTFDNSQYNLVLVHANANQNKGIMIPYEFLNGAGNPNRWSQFEHWVNSCKEMSEDKRRRLLAKNLDDADEFLARNLVDTRYMTRLFARMLRERLKFAGEPSDIELQGIEPDESGSVRRQKFEKVRVRTPQGRLTDFLRKRWGLNDQKQRDESDTHHALDACIIAACTPDLIHRVNSHFANEEQEPGRYYFRRNHNGTYTHRATNKIYTQAEAREMGLFLPKPWDGFREDVLNALRSVFVSRMVKRKRNVELHDANPYGIRYYPVRLLDLTEEMLDAEKLPPQLSGQRQKHIDGVRQMLKDHQSDARSAFSSGYSFRTNSGELKTIDALPLPLMSLPSAYLKQQKKISGKGSMENFHDEARQTVALTKLSLKRLSEKELGTAFYQRNKRLIEALKEQLSRFGDNAKKAFAEPFHVPRKREVEEKSGKGPIIRSIRLPVACRSGTFVRGGIAGLGESLRTEVYWTGIGYEFRPRYKVSEERIFGIPSSPPGARFLFNVHINNLVEVVLGDGSRKFGYFVMYEGDGRLKIRDHDRPGKSPKKKKEGDDAATNDFPSDDRNETLHRLGPGQVKSIRKFSLFKVGILGDYEIVPVPFDHGLA